jgi:hypothetical protein
VVTVDMGVDLIGNFDNADHSGYAARLSPR